MSCITIIGRERIGDQACDVPLPRTPLVWTASRATRLRGMAFDSNPQVRAVAANHPRTDYTIRSMLLRDEDRMVRIAAVKSSAISYDQLVFAMHDVDAGIRAFAKMRSEENDA